MSKKRSANKKRAGAKKREEQKANRSKSPNKRVWIFGLVALTIGIATVAWLFLGDQSTDPQTTELTSRSALGAKDKSAEGNERPAANDASSNRPAIGLVTNCQHNPPFTDALGFGQVGINTTGNLHRGLMLFDVTRDVSSSNDTNNGEGTYRHETWDDAGFLGIHTLDRAGNIYVAPWPRVDLMHNPLDAKNRIYRVDAESGVMNMLVDLPDPSQPDQANPFGTASLAYDCDTHSLYASSVAGSTRSEEMGRLFRVDPDSGEIRDQLEGFDPFGLTAFNSSGGKRIYFGLARTGDVYSLALDGDGDFRGEPRFEFSVSDLPQGAGQVVRRLKISAMRSNSRSNSRNNSRNNSTISDPYTMRVDLIKFHFNLVPPAEGQRTSYTFGYDVDADQWRFANVLQ